jgi:uncharacterized protein DUF955
MSRRIIPAPPCSGDQLEEMAILFLSKVQPEALIKPERVDIELIFDVDVPDLLGISTRYLDLPERIYGETNARKKTSTVSKKLAEHSNKSERRFFRSTLGHEIGHCIKHVKELNTFASILGEEELIHYRADQSKVPLFRNPEWQAWRLGAALLMPREPFINAFNLHGKNIGILVDIFDVNPAFVKSRIKALKLK